MHTDRFHFIVIILVFLPAFIMAGTAAEIDGWIIPDNTDTEILELIKSFELFLGMTTSEVINLLGNPMSISIQRGAEPWQDDPVFTYEAQLSLYWYNDRVWQIRLDGPDYSNLTAKSVIERMGKPWKNEGRNLIYLLPGTDFPVRLKIMIQDNRSVVYIYRGDL